MQPAVDIAGDAVGGAYSYRTAVDSAWLKDSSQKRTPHINYLSRHTQNVYIYAAGSTVMAL